jgi:hypothetical protein
MLLMNELIGELRTVRSALGDRPGPRRRPGVGRRRPGLLSAERVSSKPFIDSSDWTIDNPDRWGEEQEHARRVIEAGGDSSLGGSTSGIEALAWYESFHDDQRDWGIYIPTSSLALFDALYLAHLPIDRDRRLLIAWKTLLLHEQTHFAVDYACAWFELMLRAPVRREFASRFAKEPPLPVMERHESYLEVEEKLANAHMLREFRLGRPRAVFKALEQFAGQQPAGYRDGVKAIEDTAFAETAAETLRSYLALWAIDHRLDLNSPALRLSALLPLQNEALLAEVPVYIFDDIADVGLARGAVRLVQSIAEVIETDQFGRQFKRQQPAIRKDWSRMKDMIKLSVPNPPRFEKLKNWTPPTFSLRLRDGHRVHLEPPAGGASAWRAVVIGNHKEMGHG